MTRRTFTFTLNVADRPGGPLLHTSHGKTFVDDDNKSEAAIGQALVDDFLKHNATLCGLAYQVVLQQV